ncbi:MazG nucleotide pyrophosphohydrolase domain-containing protein [Listeria sp. PSOL-1]|uniref:MazG nucleotide pyrophosphohydrolase domain-containing protein n=1 Tax=Listeria sp. PSOL-1 TaxID=1844999 RepID=UPI0013D44CAA|nr:MazG-like family protein [Listeria sp. PSOL-1]
MEAKEFQMWVNQYYKGRNWSEFDIFTRIGFLAEETGEVARAIRAMEIGRDHPEEMEKQRVIYEQELTEELGDVLGNVMAIANHYDISVEAIFSAHVSKLKNRYQKEKIGE